MKSCSVSWPTLLDSLSLPRPELHSGALLPLPKFPLKKSLTLKGRVMFYGCALTQWLKKVGQSSHGRVGSSFPPFWKRNGGSGSIQLWWHTSVDLMLYVNKLADFFCIHESDFFFIVFRFCDTEQSSVGGTNF